MLTGSGMAIGITWCFAAIVQLVLSWKFGGGGRNDARGLAFALICGMLGISFLFDSCLLYTSTSGINKMKIVDEKGKFSYDKNRGLGICSKTRRIIEGGTNHD